MEGGRRFSANIARLPAREGATGVTVAWFGDRHCTAGRPPAAATAMWSLPLSPAGECVPLPPAGGADAAAAAAALYYSVRSADTQGSTYALRWACTAADCTGCAAEADKIAPGTCVDAGAARSLAVTPSAKVRPPAIPRAYGRRGLTNRRFAAGAMCWGAVDNPHAGDNRAGVHRLPARQAGAPARRQGPGTYGDALCPARCRARR